MEEEYIDFGALHIPENDKRTDKNARPNLRVISCCINCTFYRIQRPYRTTGLCLLPYMKPKHEGFEINVSPNVDYTARVHNSMLCDNHVWKDIYTNLQSSVKDSLKKAGSIQLPDKP